MSAEVEGNTDETAYIVCIEQPLWLSGCCCVRSAQISASSPLMTASSGAVSTPYAPSPCCKTGSHPAPETRPPGEDRSFARTVASTQELRIQRVGGALRRPERSRQPRDVVAERILARRLHLLSQRPVVGREALLLQDVEEERGEQVPAEEKT